MNLEDIKVNATERAVEIMNRFGFENQHLADAIVSACVNSAIEALKNPWMKMDDAQRDFIKYGDKCMCYDSDIDEYFTATFDGFQACRYGPLAGDVVPGPPSPCWSIDDRRNYGNKIDFWMLIPEPPQPIEHENSD